jgi:hypothetical protein
MAQKWLVGLLIILVIGVMGIFCSKTEDKQQTKWTKSSEGLLKMREYSKKSLNKDSLF